MNKQKLNEASAHKKDSVEKRRLFLKGAGLSAPIVLTLSSPSVFGAAGFSLSQMMSGNTSNVGTGSCTLGQNPSYWRNPTNKSNWPTSFSYGSQVGEVNTGCSNYSGGTKFKDAFQGSTGNGNSTLLSFVCDSSTSTSTTFLLNKYLVAALLNASTPNSNYIYTAAQVRQLQAGTLGVPPNNSKNPTDVLNFLKSTMNP